MKKTTKKKIRKVEKIIRNLPVTPQAFTYIKLYQVLEELYFQGEYALARGICNALLNK